MIGTKTVLLEWKDAYSVRNPVLDGQHKVLVMLLNSLHEAVLEGKGRGVAAGILSELVDHTRLHFSTEERIMREKGYPDFDSHKAEHDMLMAEVVRFQQDYGDGTARLTIKLVQFLKDWLSEHLVETDQKYIPYVQSH